MVNIKMEFKHPKYYKELRTRNKSDQAISDSLDPASGGDNVRSGPGPKRQASSTKLQAALEAASSKQK